MDYFALLRFILRFVLPVLFIAEYYYLGAKAATKEGGLPEPNPQAALGAIMGTAITLLINYFSYRKNESMGERAELIKALQVSLTITSMSLLATLVIGIVEKSTDSNTHRGDALLIGTAIGVAQLIAVVGLVLGFKNLYQCNNLGSEYARIETGQPAPRVVGAPAPAQESYQFNG